MKARTIRNYSDLLYSIQALANCVYPYFPPSEEWRRGVFDEAGVPYTDEPTIGQLYCIEAFLLDQLAKMHEQTERLMEHDLAN